MRTCICNPLIAVLLVHLVTCNVIAQRQTILFDLGASSQTTRGLVNNVTTPGDVGLLLTGAEDTDGLLTTVALRQVDGWCGINQKGHQGDAPYGATMMRDSFYLGDGDDRTASIRIEGLTPGEQYTFTFFASRMDSGRKRIARYQVGSRWVKLDAANNTEKQASIAAVPADIEGTATITIECADKGGYAYLGVLKIEGTFQEGSLARDPRDRLDGPPPVSATAWAIADGKTGQLLWGHNENKQRKTASTTKIMCACVVLQLAAADPTVLEEVVTFSKLADDTGGSTAGVRAGESVSVGELLYGLLLPSGNDAGNALAEHFNARLDPPEEPELKENTALATRANFVGQMNRNARHLELNDTTYRIPYGDGGTSSQFTSTARDLLKLAWTAMQDPLFQKYVNTRRHRCMLNGTDGSQRVVVWKNTNRLLQIEGYDGVKTGTTNQAGACLVSSSHRGSDHLLVVVLGSAPGDGRYVDTRNLFRWAWRQRGHHAGAQTTKSLTASRQAGKK